MFDNFLSWYASSYRQEFVGLEMVGGTIRGSLNRGAGVIGLQSTQAVNDGQWHKIRFTFDITYLLNLSIY